MRTSYEFLSGCLRSGNQGVEDGEWDELCVIVCLVVLRRSRRGTRCARRTGGNHPLGILVAAMRSFRRFVDDGTP